MELLDTELVYPTTIDDNLTIEQAAQDAAWDAFLADIAIQIGGEF